jgi:hypothetical protein
MSRIAALKRGCVVLLWLGACARGAEVRTKTAADAQAVATCSCPEGPYGQLPVAPSVEQTIDALKMADVGVRECVHEDGIVMVTIAVAGASGAVTEVITIDSPQPGSEACVERALRRICFPRFQEPVFKVQFRYKVGPQWSHDQATAVAPRCPPSATPWTGEAQRLDDAARASARRSYQAKYGEACEADLAGQKPLPPEPLPMTMSADVKESALNAHIAEVQACYQDALAGWVDLAGTIDIELVIDTSGVVESSHVSTSTFAIPEFGCCLRQVTRALQFPATQARSTITYDFTFRP